MALPPSGGATPRAALPIDTQLSRPTRLSLEDGGTAQQAEPAACGFRAVAHCPSPPATAPRSAGNWDASGALGMTWSEGDVWTADTDMPAGCAALARGPRL